MADELERVRESNERDMAEAAAIEREVSRMGSRDYDGLIPPLSPSQRGRSGK